MEQGSTEQNSEPKKTPRHSLGPAHPNINNFSVYTFICYFAVLLLRAGTDFIYYFFVSIRPKMLVHDHSGKLSSRWNDGTHYEKPISVLSA